MTCEFSLFSDGRCDLLDTCVQHINLSALIPKLNAEELLTSEGEKDITDTTLEPREGIAKLVQCVGEKVDGWKKFLAALKAETSHDGHANLVKVLKPSIEGTFMQLHTHTHTHQWRI